MFLYKIRFNFKSKRTLNSVSLFSSYNETNYFYWYFVKSQRINHDLYLTSSGGVACK